MPSYRLELLAVLFAALAFPQVPNAPASAEDRAPEARRGNGPTRRVQVQPDGSAITDSWSGYAVTGATDSVMDVKGSWVVPSVTCPASAKTNSSFWVGIDGYNNGEYLEQIGIEADCVQVPGICSQVPCYYAWYEFLPKQKENKPIPGFPVQQGDEITAEVSFSGGQFKARITDTTTKQSVTVGQPLGFTGAPRSTAEWIAEAPEVNGKNSPLADFGTVDFSKCYATVGGVATPIGEFPVANQVQITMTSNGKDSGVTEAIPSSLSKDKSSFSVSSVNLATLVSFNGTNGSSPQDPLLQAADGNFYGTTQQGGTNGDGTVFMVTPTGELTTLWNFCSLSNCADGANPFAGLIQISGGNFYGTTFLKGAHFNGTVFTIPLGGDLTPLYSFYGLCADSNCVDSGQSFSGLVQGADGNFYGTTFSGGTHFNGTVFKVTPGGAFTTLYSFCRLGGCADGAGPYASLVQGADGNLYGTTYTGGTNSVGTVFQIDPGQINSDGAGFTTLYSFCTLSNCADGGYPQAPLVQGKDGAFYGTTTFYGGGTGTIFKIKADGTPPTILAGKSFDNHGGGYAGLVQGSDGNFYGTSPSGGASGVADKFAGTVFKMTPAGKLTTLYFFCMLSVCADGLLPNAGLVQGSDGAFYGTTVAGGATNNGTIFRLSMGLKPTAKDSLPIGVAGGNP